MTILFSQERSPPIKGDHRNHERKSKPPSGGEGEDVLWPESDGNKIYKIWTSRKYSGTIAKFANILCQIHNGRR